MSKQLEIDGIGQQKASLADWKKQNKIFTHDAPHMGNDGPRWSCWAEIAAPSDFLEIYGQDAFGYGGSEKTAITDFCQKHEIELPFWWLK